MKAILFTALALTACSKDNPYYCDNAPDHNCANAPDGGGMTACTTSSQCTNPADPVCDTTNHVCVACTDGDTGACTGTAPVCSQNSCRACISHGECSSLACLPTGACGTDVEVAYAAPTGDDANPCTKDQPCKRITVAAQKGKPYVKVTGTLDEGVTIQDTNVHILADGGATVTRTMTSGPVLDIRGTSTVIIDDLTIRGAIGSTGNGINVPSGEPVTLSLAHVAVLDNAATGINVLGGSLEMSRCIVSGNKTGGAIISAAIDITNSLFVANGSGTSTTGGLTVTPAGNTNVFRFNTIADNLSSSGTSTLRGLNCAIPMSVSSSIISANAASLNCTFDYSLFDSSVTVTGTNIAGNAKFKNNDATSPMAADYYRIQQDSDALDRADPGSTMTVDIDGDTRSGAKDIGADEYK